MIKMTDKDKDRVKAFREQYPQMTRGVSDYWVLKMIEANKDHLDEDQ